jgi:hypothetical protein
MAGWLRAQGVLDTAAESSALLRAAGLSPLRETDAAERTLL